VLQAQVLLQEQVQEQVQVQVLLQEQEQVQVQVQLPHHLTSRLLP